jgi:hypothetical protein
MPARADHLERMSTITPSPTSLEPVNYSTGGRVADQLFVPVMRRHQHPLTSLNRDSHTQFPDVYLLYQSFSHLPEITLLTILPTLTSLTVTTLSKSYPSFDKTAPTSDQSTMPPCNPKTAPVCPPDSCNASCRR